MRFFGAGLITDIPSIADITIGDIVINVANGLVLLTNQYEPNPELEGSIFITGEGVFGRGIDVRVLTGFGEQGGAVYLDARNDVSVINSFIATSGAGVVGDIVINAGDTVRLEQQDRLTVAASSLEAGTAGTGGDIRITATNVELINGAQLQANTLGNGDSGNVEIRTGSIEVANGSQLSASTFGDGDAGNVVIKARDRVVFDNASAAFSRVEAGATGSGGNVDITTGSLAVTNGAQLLTSTRGTGDAGNVVVEARDRVVFDNASLASSEVTEGATGSAGNVDITANSLEVRNGAALSARTSGNGDAGNVVIQAGDTVVFDGDNSVAVSRVEIGATGAGGNVDITTGSLAVTNGAQLISNTLGTGDAGNIVIEAQNRVIFDNRGVATSSVAAGAQGTGGDLVIRTGSLDVTNGSVLAALTLGSGNAGNVVIEARDAVIFDNRSAALSSVESGGQGAGGNVVITANSLQVTNGVLLRTSTTGIGNAGNVIIEAPDFVSFDNRSGVLSSVESGGQGAGGNVVIRTGALEVTNESELTANTTGIGNAGNIIIEAPNFVIFDNRSQAFSSVESGGQGAGGNVEIRTGSLEVTNGSGLTASTRGIGNSGEIVIEARDRVLVNNRSAVSSSVEIGGEGFGGNINIYTSTLDITDGGVVNASSDGRGDAGDVVITTRDYVNLQGVGQNGSPSGIFAGNNGEFVAARSGEIRLTTPQLFIQDGAAVLSSTLNDQSGGNITLRLVAWRS
jgi:large exoprotein involved in heme utilization and adhesion